MQTPKRFVTACLLSMALASPALAQDTPPEEITFAGGTITIAETPDYEKVVSFNGKEIGRDFQAFFDRTANVAGTDVALISIGPGGNACGANTLIVWPDGNGGINTDSLPGDCGWPLPAVSDYAIIFAPWVGPGEEMPVRRWTPQDGFRIAGMLRFVPEAGTGWNDLAANPAIHPEAYFSDQEFYDYAFEILGSDLAEYALGLRVSSEMEKIADGIYATSGCVPHNCGGADSLLVVDLDARKAWFAQIRGNAIAQWPNPANWPDMARGELKRLAIP